MGSLQSRIKVLETRLSPKISKPILIFDATSDECEVFDEILTRGDGESRADFYERITAVYDAAPGLGLVIAIHAAEEYSDDGL
ncbi:hypothetical protein ABXJ76_04215 [Methylobacter sp. G7]|uniref:hypothetical protein n=1 Tax=Methylobacter sp. G7 TaxID=3230117 RepID=UPI003D805E01